MVKIVIAASASRLDNRMPTIGTIVAVQSCNSEHDAGQVISLFRRLSGAHPEQFFTACVPVGGERK